MVDFKNLVKQAKEIEDQSVATAGGDFEYTPPPAGKGPIRFIEYIELGKRPQSHDGKPKPDAEEVRITFELLGTKNIKEIDVEGGKRKIADRISITMAKKFSEKATFYKLFKIMQQGRDGITHMAEMLGEAFFGTVVHSIPAKPGDRVYGNLRKDQVWLIESPRVEDPIAQTVTDYTDKIPAALSPIRLFLWDIPTKETWDSLFIDGTREVKQADGSLKQESKNWLQENIMSAKDFQGSALEQMLGGLESLPTESKQETKTEGAQTSGTEQNTSAPAGDAEAGTTTPESSPEDDLAALGLM